MGRFTASAIKYEPLIGHILYCFPKSNYYAILSAYNPAQLIIYPVFNSLLVLFNVSYIICVELPSFSLLIRFSYFILFKTLTFPDYYKSNFFIYVLK